MSTWREDASFYTVGSLYDINFSFGLNYVCVSCIYQKHLYSLDISETSLELTH